jgi:phosphohistidine phosphatase SixA
MKLTSSIAIACLLLLALSANAFAAGDTVVFVVRHAERADAGDATARTMQTDPPLSTKGVGRAYRLAEILRDANITHVFATKYQRTRQTAARLAERRHVEVETQDDVPGLVERLRAVGGAALVVGHSNTIPEILKRLGVTESVTIGDDEFDNLFVVVRHDDGQSTLVRLKY